MDACVSLFTLSAAAMSAAAICYSVGTPAKATPSIALLLISSTLMPYFFGLTALASRSSFLLFNCLISVSYFLCLLLSSASYLRSSRLSYFVFSRASRAAARTRAAYSALYSAAAARDYAIRTISPRANAYIPGDCSCISLRTFSISAKSY
jgi:hypothetical protein